VELQCAVASGCACDHPKTPSKWLWPSFNSCKEVLFTYILAYISSFVLMFYELKMRVIAFFNPCISWLNCSSTFLHAHVIVEYWSTHEPWLDPHVCRLVWSRYTIWRDMLRMTKYWRKLVSRIVRVQITSPDSTRLDSTQQDCWVESRRAVLSLLTADCRSIHETPVRWRVKFANSVSHFTWSETKTFTSFVSWWR
jgi:hypothetical protein